LLKELAHVLSLVSLELNYFTIFWMFNYCSIACKFLDHANNILFTNFVILSAGVASSQQYKWLTSRVSEKKKHGNCWFQSNEKDDKLQSHTLIINMAKNFELHAIKIIIFLQIYIICLQSTCRSWLVCNYNLISASS
jgi:hypothetical protein